MVTEFSQNHRIEDIKDLKDSLTKFSGALVGVAMTEDEELPQLWDPFTNQGHTTLLKEIFELNVYAQWGEGGRGINVLNYKTCRSSRHLISVIGKVNPHTTVGNIHREVPQEFRAFSICLFLVAWAQKNDGSVNGLIAPLENDIYKLKKEAGLFK